MTLVDFIDSPWLLGPSFITLTLVYYIDSRILHWQSYITLTLVYYIDTRRFQIYHVTLMACFDKKLESSRPDFAVDGNRDVDCVITPGLLILYVYIIYIYIYIYMYIYIYKVYTYIFYLTCIWLILSEI